MKLIIKDGDKVIFAKDCPLDEVRFIEEEIKKGIREIFDYPEGSWSGYGFVGSEIIIENIGKPDENLYYCIEVSHDRWS